MENKTEVRSVIGPPYNGGETNSSEWGFWDQ